MSAPDYEAQIGPLLSAQSWTLSTAESCTGGLIGHLITEAPGSSAYYVGGIVSYSNQLKEQLVGVSPSTLESYGAVSKQTALEMAQGVRRKLRTDLGLSVTGIAGPGGATQDKPLGTTWIGLSTPGSTLAYHFVWSGDRQENKVASAQAALRIVYEFLVNKS